PVEREIGITLAPGRKETDPKPGAFDALQPGCGDDLIGVDVAAIQRNASPDDASYSFHALTSVPPALRKCRQSPSPPPPLAIPGACALPGPGVPRSSDSTSMRSARRDGACPGSYPSTSSTPPRATRNQRL